MGELVSAKDFNTNLAGFIIDRAAMGYSTELIKSEFERITGAPFMYSDDEIENLIMQNKDKLKAREEEIKEILSSQNFLSKLNDIYTEIQKSKEDAKERGDWKNYTNLMNSLLRNMEILLKTIEGYKKQGTSNIKLMKQNNINIFMTLESEGYISIKDKERLKKLLGVVETTETEEVIQ